MYVLATRDGDVPVTAINDNGTISTVAGQKPLRFEYISDVIEALRNAEALSPHSQERLVILEIIETAPVYQRVGVV